MRINAEEAYKMAKSKQPERDNAKRILSIIERKIETEANKGSFSTYGYISDARVDIEYITQTLKFEGYEVRVDKPISPDAMTRIFIRWDFK